MRTVHVHFITRLQNVICVDIAKFRLLGLLDFLHRLLKDLASHDGPLELSRTALTKEMVNGLHGSGQ